MKPIGRFLNRGETSGSQRARPEENSRAAPSGRAFARAKFLWLEQIAVDSELPASALRLALMIGKRMNQATMTSWPSIPTLAKELTISRQTVRNLLDALERRGHLRVGKSVGGAKSQTHRYTLLIKPGPDPSNNFEGSGVSTPQNSLANPSKKFDPNNIKNNFNNPSDGRSARKTPKGSADGKDSLLGEETRATAARGPSQAQGLDNASTDAGEKQEKIKETHPLYSEIIAAYRLENGGRPPPNNNQGAIIVRRKHVAAAECAAALESMR